MIHILHGEHHLQSRALLSQLIAAAKSAQRQVAHIEVKNLEVAGLVAQLQSQSLFNEPRTLVIEELHSLPKSKRKEALISTLKAVNQPELDVILWEKKQLTATELKQFPSAKAQVFVPTRSMFAWLNALTGDKSDAQKKKMIQLLHDAVESDGEQFCFAMLMRQVRLLMETKETGSSSQFKMVAQANSFSWPQLFMMHQKLLEIDLAQKTSATTCTITSQVELLLLAL